MKRLTDNSDAPLEVEGEIRAANVDAMTFDLRTAKDETIPGIFSDGHGATLLEALRNHETCRVRIRGRGELAGDGGSILRITHIDEIRLLRAAETQRESAAKPISERAVEFGAAIPREEWATIPRDLAKNLKHYLYGRPKVE